MAYINDQEVLFSPQVTVVEGGSVDVDTAMSDTSENPVQNKVVKAYVDEKTAPATADTYGTIKTPTMSGEARPYGFYRNDNGFLQIVAADNSQIDNRDWLNTNCPITPNNLDYAVKSVGDGYYAKVEDVGGAGTWELVEEITVSEDAVVERKYDSPFKKIIVSLVSANKAAPRVRLRSGAHYWEFYYGSFSNVVVVGDFVAPGSLADVYAIAGENGGSPAMAMPPINRLKCTATSFDGFKTDAACVAGTTIKVYGVRT